ncbi:MAG: type III pantothenate kinase [Bacteroidota bacterium]
MNYDIVIDRGNTRAKIAVFENGNLQNVFFTDADCNNLPADLQNRSFRYGILSSTAKESVRFLTGIRKMCTELICFDETIPIPLKLDHQTPESLGADRKAACVGAAVLFPEKPLLVVDAGTALTFDFLSADGKMGLGNISPGLQMRFDALHNYTGNLPLLTSGNMNKMLGQSTEESIRYGVQFGFLSEIEAYIKKLKNQDKRLITILTGGDADFLAENLKNSIFVEPNLVLIGLYRILTNYVEKN